MRAPHSKRRILGRQNVHPRRHELEPPGRHRGHDTLLGGLLIAVVLVVAGIIAALVRAAAGGAR